MKKAIFLGFPIALAFILSGCASSQSQSSGPAVDMHISGTNLNESTLYFPGPVGAVIQVTVNNPTNEAVTLQSLDLRTVATGSFRLRAGRTPVNKTIPPNSSVTLQAAVWGASRGGYLATAEPITIRGTGFFKAQSGSFIRMFTDTITPQ